MKSTERRNNQLPAFTVLLLMAVLSVIGLFVLPTLDIRYSPQVQEKKVSVYCNWPGMSERVVEAEVTSKLEGVLSGMRNCVSVSSISEKGAGSVTLRFKKNTDMAAVRFEVASRIRNLYPSLPEGVVYPHISLGISGAGNSTDLTYVFRSSLPSRKIMQFVQDRVVGPLASLDGVENVRISGATPYELEVLVNAEKAVAAGVTAGDISNAISQIYREEISGIVRDGEKVVALKLRMEEPASLEEIPVKNVNGHIIHLSDVASVRYQESQPVSYFRLNGLNTVNLNITTASGSNLVTVASSVRKTMSRLEEHFPDEISSYLSYDSSEYVRSELNKIIFRTVVCILILLVFVFLIYRSWRYLMIISTTLVVNLLAAVVIYKLTGLSIHIYTLAGITVSLGIIIDSSIVMADHYAYYHNRSVFPALLGATATTIGALCIVLLLPENDKKNLADFSKVIIINLSVALVTAYAFIPSLIDRFPVQRSAYSLSVRRRKQVLAFDRGYASFIRKGRQFRWVAVVILIFSFGIPLCLLPEEVAEKVPVEQQNFWQKTYNKVMGWGPYANNRKEVDSWLGGSFALFNKALDRSNFFREPGRNVLYITTGMPTGCTVAQLNEVIKPMENFLSKFDEVELFKTSIYSSDYATIEVYFKPEYEKTAIPSQLKSEVITMATNLGGATWRVSGIDQSYFNNNVTSIFRQNGITLSGYNYDQLEDYAEQLIALLSENRRVSSPTISSGYNGYAVDEYNIGYDFEKMSVLGINPYHYYSTLYTRLYDSPCTTVMMEGTPTRVVVRSDDAERFDLWNVRNATLQVDSTRVKLSEVGSVEKRKTGVSIYRENQSYTLTVAYDFVGSHRLREKIEESIVKKMNDEILPVGYKAELPVWNLSDEKRAQYFWLILLIVAIIFTMSAMVFESLRLPYAVILMIPISFIGVFLLFGLTDFTFDQGGFASLVMLSGIVVNAGIYLVNEFLEIRKRRSPAALQDDRYLIHDYVRSFNHKIHPIMLTIISTLLGLVPFLFDGPKDVFWFAFAVGTMSGLVFSLIALLCYMPLFALKSKKLKKDE